MDNRQRPPSHENARPARQAAEGCADVVIQASLQNMHRMLEHEIRRLQSLRKVNDHIRPREIELAQHEHQQLALALGQARVRLDAIRLITKGPPS